MGKFEDTFTPQFLTIKSNVSKKKEKILVWIFVILARQIVDILIFEWQAKGKAKKKLIISR